MPPPRPRPNILRSITERDQLRARVASFPQWHYEFDLGGGVRTPIFDPEHVNRHTQRREYFFSPLVRLCGGSLAGKRVLDLGCNAGYWALAAIDAGADFVLGVDARQMHVDQANLVFEAKGVDPSRYRFELSDVFGLDLRNERFDVVLCLGLLYHVSTPFELMERISAWNTDLLVIDTTLATGVRGPYFKVVGQDLDDPRAAADRPVALHPTAQAVAALGKRYGYRVVMLRPEFTDWEGADRYEDGSRRAFICAKQTALEGLQTEPIWKKKKPPAAAPQPAAETAAQGARTASLRARLRRLARGARGPRT
jgi:tRNA (mo5U34)-methyltransferase